MTPSTELSQDDGVQLVSCRGDTVFPLEKSPTGLFSVRLESHVMLYPDANLCKIKEQSTCPWIMNYYSEMKIRPHLSSSDPAGKPSETANVFGAVAGFVW